MLKNQILICITTIHCGLKVQRPCFCKMEAGSQACLEEGLSLGKSSFLWPYIIPANIPLGIQYYHLLLRSALFEASCREHNEVSKAGSSQPFQSLIAVVVLASNSSHANTARSILGMAKYGQINVKPNLVASTTLSTSII